jgi:hypothetical protein
MHTAELVSIVVLFLGLLFSHRRAVRYRNALRDITNLPNEHKMRHRAVCALLN